MFRSIGHSFLILALASVCTAAIAQEKPSESSRDGKTPAARSSSSKSAAAKPSSSESDSAQASSGTKRGKSTTTGKKLAGRLPRFFASIVDQEQRDEIYQIQATYREKLAALEQELAELKEAEMSAMEGVLTTAQRKKLDEIRASAEKSAKAKSASSKTLAAKSSAKD